MLYAYADQNFLSSCTDKPEWIKYLEIARAKRVAHIVLSPLHFYEFGNAKEKIRETVLDVVETLEPAWTFSPADQQMIELVSLWREVWVGHGLQATPITSLNQVVAVMHRVSLRQAQNVTLRQVVGAFQGVAQRQLKGSLSKQEEACAVNQTLFRRNRLTKSLISRIDAEHVAVQLARWEKDEDPSEVLGRAHQMLANQPIATYIDCFLYWQLHRLLRAYEVESHLSEQMWSSPAKLNVNRFVDRMHAVVAPCHTVTFL